MARDQHAVLGRDKVRLDVVCAELDAQRVVLQRVVGQVAGGTAAVADDQRGIVGVALGLGLAGRRQCGHRGGRQQRGRASSLERLHAYSSMLLVMNGAGPYAAPVTPG